MTEETQEIFPENEDVIVPLIDGNTKSALSFRRFRQHIPIEPAAILYLMYFAGTLPLLQQYVLKRVKDMHNITSENATKCNDNGIEYSEVKNAERETSLWMAAMSGVQLIPVLISSITVSSYSDKIGRKVAMYLPLFGASVALLIYILIVNLSLPLYYIFVGKVFEGLCGGSSLFIAALFSYAADISTTDKRKFQMIRVQISLYLGTVISEIGIGYLIRFVGYIIPFYVILSFCVINCIYVALLLESVQNPKHIKSVVSEFSWDIPKQSFLIYVHDTNIHRRWKLQVMALVLFITVWCDLGKFDVMALYVLGPPFCFSPIFLGYFFSSIFIASGIGNIIITKTLQHRLTEMSFMVISMISSISCMLVLAYSRSKTLVFSSSLFGMFTYLTGGMIRSYNSKLMKDGEQGAMFASIAWIESAATVIGSVVFDVIYTSTISIYNGFVFFVIAALYIVNLVIICVAQIREENEEKRKNKKTIHEAIG